MASIAFSRKLNEFAAHETLGHSVSSFWDFFWSLIKLHEAEESYHCRSLFVFCYPASSIFWLRLVIVFFFYLIVFESYESCHLREIASTLGGHGRSLWLIELLLLASRRWNLISGETVIGMVCNTIVISNPLSSIADVTLNLPYKGKALGEGGLYFLSLLSPPNSPQTNQGDPQVVGPLDALERVLL